MMEVLGGKHGDEGLKREKKPTSSRVIATLQVQRENFEGRHSNIGGGGKIKKLIKTIH